MEGEVVHHRGLVEFRSHLKCEACQRNDNTCIVQRDTGRCISCKGAGVECTFARTLSLRGPKACFPWEWLLNASSTQSLEEGLEISQRRILSKTIRQPGPRRNLRQLWRKAFLVCCVINRFRAVNRYQRSAINNASNHKSVVTQDSLSKQHYPSIFSIPRGLSQVERSLQEPQNAGHTVLGPENSCRSKVKEVGHTPGPFAVFEVGSMEEVNPRGKIRSLSQQASILATKTRYLRACSSCRLNKKRVRVRRDRRFEVY